MSLFYSSERAELHHGDALKILPTLPSSSVDALVTDAPYSSGGMVRGDRAGNVRSKYVQTDSQAGQELRVFPGDNRDQRSFTLWAAMWLSEALHVVRPGGAAVLFTDWRQLPAMTDALQVAGWVWRGIAIWHKPNGRQTLGRFANNSEFVVWGTNGPRPGDVIEGTLPGLYTVPTLRAGDGEKEHITQKPLALMRSLVRIAPPGATILDPFSGSGSTGVAALHEGRRFVGVELDPHWANVTARRLATAEAEHAEALPI